eukprot:TRINITY_DN17882_c0_g1_i1.p1 TRINITY_DN17882_c0_g1~~TRINITY_DN17882_c0_g1_i1.p1  ORF type:complete len:879 (+),score=144.37 TRINITY_DN17882_c0_g1_i1:805-3441(+)
MMKLFKMPKSSRQVQVLAVVLLLLISAVVVVRLTSSDARLEEQLRAAAMPNKMVIITMFTFAWKDMLDLWLERLRLVKNAPVYLHRHVVVVALEKEGFQYCKMLGLRCWLDTQGDAEHKFEFGGGEQFTGSPGYVALTRRKVEVVLKVVKAGYHVVYSDLDCLWLKTPPLPFDLHPGAGDMVVSTKAWSRDKLAINVNSGLFFLRQSERAVKFLQFWLKCLDTTALGLNDQYALQLIRPDTNLEVANEVGLDMRYIPTTVCGSFCEAQQTWVELTTFHADCNRGLEDKKASLVRILELHDMAMEEFAYVMKHPLHEDPFALLATVQLPKKLALVTALSSEEHSLLDLFYSRMSKQAELKKYLPKMLVLTVDPASYFYCQKFDMLCYFDNQTLARHARHDSLHVHDVDLMAWRTLTLIEIVLKSGHSVLYTTLDVLWLKDFVPLILQATRGGSAAIQCDSQEALAPEVEEPLFLGPSLWYLPSVSAVSNSLEAVIVSHETTAEPKDFRDVAPCTKEARARFKTHNGVKTVVLSSMRYGSLCHLPANLSRLVSVHSACLTGSSRMTGLLDFLRRYDVEVLGTSPSMEDEQAEMKRAGQPLVFPTLEAILAEAAPHDKTVFVSPYPLGDPDGAALLALRKKRSPKEVLERTIIVTMSLEKLKECRELGGFFCFFDELGPREAPDVPLLELAWHALAVVQRILLLEYSVVFADDNVLWLKDPVAILQAGEHDLAVMCREQPQGEDAPDVPATDFWYMRGTTKSQELIQMWQNDRLEKYMGLDPHSALTRIFELEDERTRVTHVIQLGMLCLPPSFTSSCRLSSIAGKKKGKSAEVAMSQASWEAIRGLYIGECPKEGGSSGGTRKRRALSLLAEYDKRMAVP